MSPHHSDRTLIRGGTLLTLDPAIGDFAKGDVLVQGDRIVAVGLDLGAENARVIDGAGMIVMPGFVDAHRHAWQGTLRRLMPNVATLDAYIDATHFSLARFYRPADRTELSGCRHDHDHRCVAQCTECRTFRRVDRRSQA